MLLPFLLVHYTPNYKTNKYGKQKLILPLCLLTIELPRNSHRLFHEFIFHELSLS